MDMDFKTELKKAYDADAQRRSKNEDKRDEWKIQLRKKFAQLAKKEGKKSLLELGAGVGVDAKYFLDQGFDVLAIDLSPEMVKKCREKGLNARVLDLYELSSLGKTFDCVYSLNVLLHTPRKDLRRVLTSISKILNPNGLFFFGVYGGYDAEKTIVDKTKMNLPRLFSFLSDASLLKAAGEVFEVVSFETLDVGSNEPNFHFQSLTLRKRDQ